MRYTLTTALVLALTTLAFTTARGQESDNPMVGKPFRFEVTTLEGKSLSDADEKLQGKVRVIDIWGSWCGPCLQALPHMEALHEKYKDDGLEVIGIAFERGEADTMESRLKAFVKERGMKYTVALGGSVADEDKSGVLPDLKNFQGYPTFVLIGRDGKVSEVLLGFIGDEQAADYPTAASPSTLDTTVRKLLGLGAEAETTTEDS